MPRDKISVTLASVMLGGVIVCLTTTALSLTPVCLQWPQTVLIPFVVWACRLSGQHIFKADLLLGLQRSLCTTEIQLLFTESMITFVDVS